MIYQQLYVVVIKQEIFTEQLSPVSLDLVARVIRCNKCMDGDGETKMTYHFIAPV